MNLRLFAGDKESMKRTYEMLMRMKEEDEQSDDNLDSDDDEELVDRLEGVNLDDADEVWKRLTPAERSEFQRMCTNGIKLSKFFLLFRSI